MRFFRSKKSENLTDEELLARFRGSSNSDDLGVLYGRYLEMVFGVCLKIFKDRGRSEDAVMAIFEELLTKAKVHEIGAFRGWLYVLARNYCLQELRKSARKPTNLLAPADMAKFDGADDSFDFDLPNAKTDLQKCLETLNIQQKSCVLAFYFDEKSYKEISDETKIELGTVRSFIQNGRRNLKICLEKNEN
jgi:RNA polymerase sigma factor (sigma-70 family)